MKSICRVIGVGLGLVAAVVHDVSAQSLEIHKLRSSLGVLANLPDFARDTAYIDILDRLAYVFYGVRSDSAFYYGHLALEYSNRAGYAGGRAESWRILGNTYEMTGDYGNMLAAYHQSLDIAEKSGNNRQIAKATSNIALFDEQQGEYDQARLLMEKVMTICLTEGDSLLVPMVYMHLSENAIHRRQNELALKYAAQALQTAAAIRDETQLAACRNEMGKILAATGDSHKAIGYYEESLRHYREAGDSLGFVSTTALLAQAWLQLRAYSRALGYALQSLSGAESLRRKPEIRESARALAAIYEATGDDRRALQYFRVFKDYSDSLFNDENRKRILALAAGYDFEKKETKLRNEQAISDERYRQALHEDAIKIGVTILVIAALCLLAVILFRSRNINRRMTRLLQDRNGKIEEQKEVLEQQAVQLLLNNREKDKLFSIVAHDLRGPLNSLKMVMDHLKEKQLSEIELRDILNEFRRNVDYSSELVSNLLVWASSQLDGIVVRQVVVRPQPVVQDILALFSQQARQKNVHLAGEIDASLRVFADEDMIQVILRNLVSNAIKFCRPGDAVTVSGFTRDAAVTICVADTGIGLREDALEMIRRKESFTSYGTAKEKGTGLGMLICREFTEANGGCFWVESEWEKGCRCYFSLPVGPVSL